MADFKAGTGTGYIWGRNEFLRSWQDVKTESYTLSKDLWPTDAAGQKIAQPGTLLAKATSGAQTGKVGPFDLAALDGRQTYANVVGLLLTYLPWQLLERDVEISAVYAAAARQDWCRTYTGAAGAAVYTPMTNAMVDALVDVKGLDLIFK